MIELIKKIRKRPEEERQAIAVIFGLSVTLFVGILWGIAEFRTFSLPPVTLPNFDTSSSSSALDQFGQLKNDLSDQLNALQGSSQQQDVPATDSGDLTQPSQTDFQTPPASTPVSPASYQSTVDNPTVQPVRLEAQPASSPASSTVKNQ